MRVRNSFMWLSLLAAAICLLFVGCNRPGTDELRFGVILSLTGPAATYGQDNLRGLQLAQGVLNERGGINGKRVELNVQDSAGDPAQAVTLARRFASDRNIIAIL